MARLSLPGLLILAFGCFTRGYVITTPRQWTVGQAAQVCIWPGRPATAEDLVTIHVSTASGTRELMPAVHVHIPEGLAQICQNIMVTPLRGHSSGILNVTGSLGGVTVAHNQTIKLYTDTTKTFIQTDKYMYKPGQLVQFRILTLVGPFLQVSTQPYSLVFVETPSGSRIAQWRDVDNSGGLCHLFFQLSEEPEEGEYKIEALLSGSRSRAQQKFKVEEFVLPRFELTLTSPGHILGTHTSFTFTLCAKYTYGQPLKGNATVTLKHDTSHYWPMSTVLSHPINGCEDFIFSASSISFSSYFGTSLKVSAKVVEEGTSQEMEKDITVNIERTALIFKDIRNDKYLKPYLPFTAKVKVRFFNGTPAAGEAFEVWTYPTTDTKYINADRRGILDIVIGTSELVTSDNPFREPSIYIKSVNYGEIKDPSSPFSWGKIMHSSEHTIRVGRYFSPSSSSLQLLMDEGKLPCTDTGSSSLHPFTVLYAATPGPVNLTVQVLSRGQIQYWQTREVELQASELPVSPAALLNHLSPPPSNLVTGALELKLDLPATVSPTVKVLVWYARQDGEVVSDTKTLKVHKCFTQNVDLAWSQPRAAPGDLVNLSLTAYPNSLCSLGVVDKSVEILSTNNDPLTLAEVFKLVEKMTIDEQDNSQYASDYEYCLLRNWLDVDSPRNGNGLRLKRSGFLPWGMYRVRYVDASKMFDASGLFFFSSNLTVETRPCEEREPEVFYLRSVYSRSGGPGYAYDGSPDNVYDLTVDASSGVMDSQPYPSSVSPRVDQSSSQVRTYFPETWLWQLSRVPESGEQVESVSVPHTVTKWVGRAACVHPQQGLGVSEARTITTFTPFFIDLTLPPSVKRGEILPVKISVFNYVDESLPVRVRLAPSEEYEILGDAEAGMAISCIPAQEKVVHTVQIQLGGLGDVNLTVQAWVEEEGEVSSACSPGMIISKSDHIVKPIKVEVEGFPKEKTWTKFICSQEIEENADYLENWDIEVPSDIVRDSARAWLTVVGDLLGPTLENLGSLIRMPYGCGEQNMLNFAPNIYILQYLKASNQSVPHITEKAINYMEHGYQRELNYRHSVGSYSAFGSSDASGSTWLTAFVLKSFAQAQQFIKVDQEDLEMSQRWLRDQQLENGCFASLGKILHKDMKGGVGEGDSLVPLTAYVLVALLEAGEVSTSRHVSEAAFCLQSDQSSTPYTLALKAYAQALAGLPMAQTTIQHLLSLATETSSALYWQLSEEKKQNDAVMVEIGGYAVLAMTTLNADEYFVQTQKIVKWISTKRNGQGGFISTQDTVVALQALASFEKHMTGLGAPDLAVLVEAGTLAHDFRIDDTNKLLQQSVKLPEVPTSVILDMTGQGCALIQAVLRYNIPEDLPSEAFSLSVNTSTAPDDACLTKRLKVCAAYLLPDRKSNMAIIEINLVSGYIPKKADLKQIVSYGSGIIKRYEVDGAMVNFYIDEFSSRDICLEFGIKREVEVEQVKPGTVKVYDYYRPELFVSKSYTLPPVEDCRPSLDMVIDDIIVEPIIADGCYVSENFEPEAEVTADRVIEDFLNSLDDIMP